MEPKSIKKAKWYLSTSFSSSITSKEAMATALAKGFPPNVLIKTIKNTKKEQT